MLFNVAIVLETTQKYLQFYIRSSVNSQMTFDEVIPYHLAVCDFINLKTNLKIFKSDFVFYFVF